EIMRQSKGTHFDPKVLEAFFEVLPEILSIRELYQEEATSPAIPPSLVG
ncbi:MAG: hypothetical protein QOH90_50, partial [Actinomycetota bacterium]|nr:hypothetical protein [Actinomycetota bacterium]